MIENVEYVEMAYAGLNDGPRHYRGYMNRSYSVKRGDVVPVHPEDVPKLSNIIVQGMRLFELVNSNLVTYSEPDNGAVGGGEPNEGTGTAVDATDGAKELAGEFSLDLALVTGTGKDGRITKTDVESYLNAQDD